jgi:hypothetical protein
MNIMEDQYCCLNVNTSPDHAFKFELKRFFFIMYTHFIATTKNLVVLTNVSVPDDNIAIVKTDRNVRGACRNGRTCNVA